MHGTGEVNIITCVCGGAIIISYGCVCEGRGAIIMPCACEYHTWGDVRGVVLTTAAIVDSYCKCDEAMFICHWGGAGQHVIWCARFALITVICGRWISVSSSLV